MAMYICTTCGNLTDDDWHPMDEDENCPQCHDEAEENKEAALIKARKSLDFDSIQLLNDALELENDRYYSESHEGMI